MTILLIIGVVTTFLGLAGLGVCIKKAAELKALKDDPEAQKSRMHGLVALNMAAVGVAFIGLAMVVVSLILG